MAVRTPPGGLPLESIPLLAPSGSMKLKKKGEEDDDELLSKVWGGGSIGLATTSGTRVGRGEYRV